MPKVATLDVLHDDDRIVHHPADSYGEPGQREDVERVVAELNADHGDQ